MKFIKDLGIRLTYQPRVGTYKNFRFGLFLCPVCGDEAERKTKDGMKQKRCCGGISRIAKKGTPLHNRYIGMTQRCWDKNAIGYKHYGGRGIGVCDAWRNFDNFARWAIANGFDPAKDLDRIDNDGDYCPENCRFITHAENSRNKRDNIHTRDEIIEIIRLYVCTPITYVELADKFNDSAGNISNIIRKRTWDIETEWDQYIDIVVEVKRMLPNKIRYMWFEPHDYK